MPIDRNTLVNKLRALRNTQTLSPDQISTIHNGIEHLLHELDAIRAKIVELESKIGK